MTSQEASLQKSGADPVATLPEHNTSRLLMVARRERERAWGGGGWMMPQ